MQYKNNKDRILHNIKEEWCERLQSYCWIWQGYCTPKGYGTTQIKGKNKLVHRVSYQEFIGPIPKDLPNICHQCDTPPCCNPEHLFPGTNQDNMKDRDNKNRQAKGSQQGLSKLTDNNIIQICSKYASGNYTQTELAEEYNISQTQIGQIVRGKHWKHLL